jgi:hypothetical protein
MPRFMYIFRGGGYATPDSLSPTELQQHLAKWTAWTGALLASTRQASAHALSHPPTGATIRGRDKVVTDGPYAESKDLVSGVFVLDAASLEEATEVARGCPILELGGSVEVRPVMAAPPR